jgi:hypothetical protein
MLGVCGLCNLTSQGAGECLWSGNLCSTSPNPPEETRIWRMLESGNRVASHWCSSGSWKAAKRVNVMNKSRNHFSIKDQPGKRENLCQVDVFAAKGLLGRKDVLSIAECHGFLACCSGRDEYLTSARDIWPAVFNNRLRHEFVTGIIVGAYFA